MACRFRQRGSSVAATDGRFGFVRIDQIVRLQTDAEHEDAARHVVAKAEQGCLVTVSLDLPVQTTVRCAPRPAWRSRVRRGHRDGESEPASAVVADRLVEPWLSCLDERLRGVRIFDCHTHVGCADPDGSCFSADELHATLDVVNARAVVFPLAEPGSYRAANERVLAVADKSDGRLVPFCRVDPHTGGLEEARRAVGRGAAGIKLHPRAEQLWAG